MKSEDGGVHVFTRMLILTVIVLVTEYILYRA